MEERQELLSELVLLSQQKYTCLLEIERLTREIGDMLSVDDRESVQMLIEMRQEEMNRADEIVQRISLFLESADLLTAAELRDLFDWRKELPADTEEPDAKRIKDFSVRAQKILERTISIDKVISQRLAGKDSYYSG